ncbi:MAG: DegT/DnrJ/EryC1/StrS family aminotransferase [Desulfobacteraceae bacterium]|jgi:8-amino-3,8-dideoxy-alpha-D-manno-octulosonate transaminase|nr:MAG: DegT/DnrJ/EryC1/StrS family aminotransferase [Desulfobacteraceae bacterium]
MPGYEVLGEEEKKQILEVLASKVLFRYEFHAQRAGVYKVAEFEKAFSEYCGVKCALAVSSGTAALKVALAALGIGPGDEVITQGFTFVATWEAILEAGAIPIFAEIDDTLCMDPGAIRKKVTSRTKAILPVHMCGGQARIDEITGVANKLGIPVIEDTAQACGGSFKGKKLGSFGAMGCFSFDSVKTITTGEGGMVTTDDQNLYTRASEYHDHGHDHDVRVGRGLEKRNFVGFNYRMMELQGALGLAQLEKLDPVIIKRQRENKQVLKDALTAVKGVTFRTLPDPEGDIASFLIFFLPTTEKARTFAMAMAQEGSPPVYWHENTWHYYGKWEHLLEGKSPLSSGYPFRDPEGAVRASFHPEALPITSSILSKALTIPINVNMEKDLPGKLKAIGKAAEVLKAA